VNFLYEICKESYIGNWTTQEKIFDFENTDGVIEMEIYNRPLIFFGILQKIYVYIIINIRDGIYLDRWVNIQSVTSINSKEEFDYLKKELIFKNLNASIRRGHVMSIEKNYKSKSSLLIKKVYSSNLNMTWNTLNDSKSISVNSTIDIKDLPTMKFSLSKYNDNVRIKF